MYDVRFEVYLLAENRLFRESLTRILSKMSELRIAGEASPDSGSEPKIAELKPNVLLADATVLAYSGIIPNLRKLLPELKILMIGMDADRDLFLRAVREGVQGYVLKDASATEVAAAVRAVINQEAVCPPSLVSILFESVAQWQTAFPTARVQRQLGLSRREQQVIHMISEGLTNKEIATRLGLSQQTVKNHIHRMLRKVGANDRLAIVERWYELREAPAAWSASRTRSSAGTPTA